jgi:signal transduction histidine kinase
VAGYLFAAACVVLLCGCYLAGRAALPPWRTAAVAAAAACVPAAQFAIRPAGRASVAGFLSAYLVFAALPLLAGRYVSVQRKAAKQEALRERLGIAREMHDSLGRRLSLAAVQAAALEVAGLPAPQRAAVARLAIAIRATVTELHEVVGALRNEHPRARGVSAVGPLIAEFRAAGAQVSAWSHGTPRPLPAQADEAAYRVIEEGLTNAVRHAPGRPVSVTIAWEAGGLRLSVANPAEHRVHTPGSGLSDLAWRLRQAGGSLAHEVTDGQFRLRAALPAGPARGTHGRPGIAALGVAVGALLLVILPATVLLGVR